MAWELVSFHVFFYFLIEIVYTNMFSSTVFFYQWPSNSMKVLLLERMWFKKLCHSWKLRRMHVFSQQLERLMGYLFFIWTMLEEVYPMRQASLKLSCPFFWHFLVFEYIYTHICMYNCIYTWLHVNVGFFNKAFEYLRQCKKEKHYVKTSSCAGVLVYSFCLYFVLSLFKSIFRCTSRVIFFIIILAFELLKLYSSVSYFVFFYLLKIFFLLGDRRSVIMTLCTICMSYTIR